MCDDDCPNCGARHWSPVESDDQTFLVERQGKFFVVSESPRSAEHTPNYDAIAATMLRAEAEAVVSRPSMTYWS